MRPYLYASLLLTTAGAVGALWWLSAGPGAREGRQLTRAELDLILPALARTNRPGLMQLAAVSNRILEAAGQTTPFLRYDGSPTVETERGSVEVPPSFPKDLATMGRTLERIQATRGHDADPLGDRTAVAALKETFTEMRRTQVVEAGVAYRVSRYGLLLSKNGNDSLVLASEPVLAAVSEMDEARGSWEQALAVYQRHRTLWLDADPRRVFEGLLRRDAERRYDEEKRRVHLTLALQTLIPNLVETVTIDLAGILELSLDDPLDGDIKAVIAVRQLNDLNRLRSGEDEAFAAKVAPVYVVLSDDTTMRLLGAHQRSTTVSSSVD